MKSMVEQHVFSRCIRPSPSKLHEFREMQRRVKVASPKGGYTQRALHLRSLFPLPHGPTLRRWRVAAVFLLALGAGRPAIAADSCQVELSGPESGTWQSAVHELDTELQAARLLSDCARISLHAADGRAQLVFTTKDARRAERSIDDPIELIPTVQALSISVPSSETDAASAPASQPESKRPASTERTRPSRERAEDGAPTPVNPYALSPILGAGVGFRGGANRLITPTASGTIALSIDRWELGLIGRYEAHYVTASGGNEGLPETSGLVLGPTFGFRQPTGKLALRGGGMLLLAALQEDGGAKNGRAEGRVGIYAGGVYPRASKLRFRFDLGGELVPYNIGRSERNVTGAWSLPWWAITFTLGLELG